MWKFFDALDNWLIKGGWLAFVLLFVFGLGVCAVVKAVILAVTELLGR